MIFGKKIQNLRTFVKKKDYLNFFYIIILYNLYHRKNVLEKKIIYNH